MVGAHCRVRGNVTLANQWLIGSDLIRLGSGVRLITSVSYTGVCRPVFSNTMPNTIDTFSFASVNVGSLCLIFCITCTVHVIRRVSPPQDNQMEWWKCVMKGDPEINTAKVRIGAGLSQRKFRCADRSLSNFRYTVSKVAMYRNISAKLTMSRNISIEIPIYLIGSFDISKYHYRTLDKSCRNFSMCQVSRQTSDLL